MSFQFDAHSKAFSAHLTSVLLVMSARMLLKDKSVCKTLVTNVTLVWLLSIKGVHGTHVCLQLLRDSEAFWTHSAHIRSLARVPTHVYLQ